MKVLGYLDSLPGSVDLVPSLPGEGSLLPGCGFWFPGLGSVCSYLVKVPD